jgi:uncharacterized OB-fold protein
MEPIVKKWYDGLAKGKITGAKCADCGEVTFPPMTVCRECRSRHLQTIEMSGKGTAVMFSSTILPAKPFADMAPIPYGIVKTEEGPCLFTKIEGVDCSSPEAIRRENEKLPAPAEAKIVNAKGINIVIFKKL